ncbi:hypothetical protein Tco_1298261, partial [Tanacetum coccineum]
MQTVILDPGKGEIICNNHVCLDTLRLASEEVHDAESWQGSHNYELPFFPEGNLLQCFQSPPVFKKLIFLLEKAKTGMNADFEASFAITYMVEVLAFEAGRKHRITVNMISA